MTRISLPHKSLTFRIALLYMALFAGSVAILLGFVHYTTAGYLARETKADITAEANELAVHFRQGGMAALAREISGKAAANTGRRSIYLLTDANYQPIAGNIDRWPEEAVPDDEGWLQFPIDGIPGGPEPIRGRVYRPGDDMFLLIGRNVREQQAFSQLIAAAVGWGLFISVILAAVGGTVTSRTIARRLEQINDTAREVMAGDLGQRVPNRGANDEFDRLADNLNRMLDRIEFLMGGVRQVSDNIAHDLRTPLTRLRWRLEKLQEGGDPELLTQAINDADGLLHTFHALLRIAEAESGSCSRFKRIDLAEIACDVSELYEPVASTANLALETECETPVPAHGDRDLLFQAMTNLVDNAVKYTLAGGSIRVGAAQRGDGRMELYVADTGPGVPADRRDDVLRRFYRLEENRASPGSGLGLSLVAAVAQLHNGEVLLEDNEPGLRVRLILPDGD